MTMKQVKADLYETITNQVIAMMETHGSNWTNPFNKGSNAYRARNGVTGASYRGINEFLLAFTPFQSPYYAGFQQWHSKGCSVKKGSKGTMIVYFNMIKSKDKATGKETVFPMLKHHHVFNAEQVEGEFAAKLLAPTVLVAKSEVETITAADAVLMAAGANIKHSAKAQAFYSPSDDYIHMPDRSLFSATATSSATETYYGTLAHELTHWTGHASRLNRNLANRFGSEAYAAEELVAELGAAMLSAELGISSAPRADHAEYLNSWIRVLKNDKKAITKAATLAKQAVEYIAEVSVGGESEEIELAEIAA